jgi:hypothetical protein
MIKKIANSIVLFLLLEGVFSLIFSFFIKDWFYLICGTIYVVLSTIYINQYKS